MLTAAVRLLARLYPWEVEASTDLERHLAFLDADVDGPTVVRAGYGAALAISLVAPVAFALLPRSVRFAAGLAVVGAGFVAAHAVHRAPAVLALARRTSALGEAPDLVGRAVLRMHVEPTAEAAAAFAARTGSGPLAASLDDHGRRAAGTPGTGFEAFASEWAAWQPSLRRSLALVEAAANAPAGERGRTLDRALRAVLDGTRDRMAEFAGDIRGPATGLYAFGVLLPLALVGVLPAARVAGVPVTLTAVVAIYDVFLPVSVLVAGGWLLARRPVAFAPPRVRRSHPDVPGRRWHVAAAAIAVGTTGWLLAATLLPPWTRWVALVGCLVGVALVGLYRPIKAVRDEVRAVEADLTDALYLVGRRVQRGEAVETAVERTSDEVPGATGETFADAARIQRQLRSGVREAFLSDHGALADVPSPRARSTASLLALAAREGRPAGRAVVAMADHLEELLAVEREARRELASVTGTLRSTATVFGPLVAGATVALADGMSASAGLDGQTQALSVGALGLAVGVYVLFLAAVLAALAVGLERGLDRALVGYRVGEALLSATAVYLAAFVAAGALV